MCPCCICDSIIDALFSASGLPCNQQRIPEQHKGEGCANLNEFSHSQLIYIIYMYLADMFPPSQAAAGWKTGAGLHKLKVLNEHVQSDCAPTLPAGSQPTALPSAYPRKDNRIRNRTAASMPAPSSPRCRLVDFNMKAQKPQGIGGGTVGSHETNISLLTSSIALLNKQLKLEDTEKKQKNKNAACIDIGKSI